jgi:hypothetical protein
MSTPSPSRSPKRPLAQLEPHPALTTVPAMPTDEYEAFRADIAERGIVVPLEMHLLPLELAWKARLERAKPWTNTYEKAKEGRHLRGSGLRASTSPRAGLLVGLSLPFTLVCERQTAVRRHHCSQHWTFGCRHTTRCLPNSELRLHPDMPGWWRLRSHRALRRHPSASSSDRSTCRDDEEGQPGDPAERGGPLCHPNERSLLGDAIRHLALPARRPALPRKGNEAHQRWHDHRSRTVHSANRLNVSQ